MAQGGDVADGTGGRPFRRPARAGAAGGLFLATILVFTAGAPEGARAAVSFPRISTVPKLSGLSLPVQVTHAGDNTGRLFVVEQGGRIRLTRDGTLQPTPFLDIAGRVLANGEQGLLGLAFPPGYAATGRFYVNYTRAGDGATVVSRFGLTANPDVADSASEQVLLVIGQPFANHNGGQIAFGPDGYLYIGMGDGGSGGDPQNNAQNPGTLLGKMLRIDVESGAVPYAVPPSNPFAADNAYLPEIWALGLRNPWRFAFDRGTGDLFIGDVGQNAFEEIDYQPAGSPGGENYGWRIMEGLHCFGNPFCDAAGLTLPIAEYGHAVGCSVTGGTVYRGTAYPRMQGVYLYGDFCSGLIWGLRRDGEVWASAVLLDSPLTISCFGEDEAGNLYVADYGGGAVHEVVAPNAPPSPPALVAPEDGMTGLPRDVAFSWSASADPDGDPVTYEFFLATDPSFTGAVPVRITPSTAAGRTAAAPAGWVFALVLPGTLLLAARGRTRGWRSLLFPLVAFLLLCGGAGAGCGGDSSSGNPAPSAPGAPATLTHTVAGLLPNTVYYWRVAAGDGLDTASSPARSFVTGP